MKKYVFFLSCCATLLLGSCKSSKTGVTAVSETSTHGLPKKAITEYYKSSFDYQSLRAKLRVKYTDGKKSFSPSVSLRMQKDEVIWVSVKVLGIVMAKLWMSPTRVRYYEVLNNTYFDGDFSLLSKLFGATLDFESVQNALIGLPFSKLADEKCTIAIRDSQFFIRTEGQEKGVERNYIISATQQTLAQQQWLQALQKRTLAFSYPEYQKVENQNFPKIISVEATQNQKNKRIEIDYKDVIFNTDLSFPFNIPSGAKQIEPK